MQYNAISVTAEKVTAPIPIPKFGIGRKYRPKPLVSVSVSEPKLFQPKPKLQYIDFSEITLSTYVHVLHGKSEIT